MLWGARLLGCPRTLPSLRLVASLLAGTVTFALMLPLSSDQESQVRRHLGEEAWASPPPVAGSALPLVRRDPKKRLPPLAPLRTLPSPVPSLTTRKTPGGPTLKDILQKTRRVQTLPPKHPSEGASRDYAWLLPGARGWASPQRATRTPGAGDRMYHPQDRADPGRSDLCTRHLRLRV